MCKKAEFKTRVLFDTPSEDMMEIHFKREDVKRIVEEIEMIRDAGNRGLSGLEGLEGFYHSLRGYVK